MNSSLLSPALLHTAAVVVFGSAIALVAIHTNLLAAAGARTTLPSSTRVRVSLAAALLLSAWLAWAIVISHQRSLAAMPLTPPSPLAALPTLLAIVGAIGFGSAFLASPNVRTLNAAMPPWWLIAVQFYRAAGIMFVWPFIHVLPAGFALPAGIGDAITGVAAPLVALAVARGQRGAYRRAVLWNWFGIADLIVAPTAAVLSGAQVATLYPISLIPIFLGPPLGILTHIYSLRNLAANRAQFDRAIG